MLIDRGLLLLSLLIAGASSSCGEPPSANVPSAGAEDGGGALPQHQDAAVTSSSSSSKANALPLIPRPRSLQRRCEGALTIDATTRIRIEPDSDGGSMRDAADRLARWLGLTPKSVEVLPPNAPEPPAGIVLRRAPGEARTARDVSVEPPKSLEDEAYSVDVNPRRATIRAKTRAGFFYGTQTLAQLAGARRIGAQSMGAPGYVIPCATIDDSPRFAFRSMHLDVARNFFNKAVVERYIDLLAFYRFNVFHWHLIDDQGFRIEIKSHPELTQVGGTDGFFTQEDIKEVVAYAKERSITVLPEIEMPGHARAILASHPELSCTGKKQEVPRTWGIFEDVLCAGNDKTYDMMSDILGEVAKLFPSQAIHVGGDEVPTTRWEKCPKCRALIAKEKIKGPHEIEGVFMRRIQTILGKLGKKPVVWDEAMESLAATGSSPMPVIMAWQSTERGKEALKRELDVVMAPQDQVYFDFKQSPHSDSGREGQTPWSKVHAFDPIPDGVDPAKASAHVVGGAGMLWSERITTPEKLETMAMPRVAALADVLWSPAKSASREDFVARFNAQLPALDAAKIQYWIDPPVGVGARKVFIESEAVAFAPPRLFPKGAVRFTKDGTDPTLQSPLFEAPITVKESTTIASALFLPNGRMSTVVRSNLVKETPRPATTLTKPEAGVLVSYVEGDFHKLPDFAKTPALRPKVRATGISLAAAEKAVKPRKEHFALRFEGFVKVPADGVYRFVSVADDGARIEIDGETIVNDDGEHAPREAGGEIALASGAHHIVVSYFQGAEGKTLDVTLEGPTGEPGALDLVTDVSAPPPAGKR